MYKKLLITVVTLNFLILSSGCDLTKKQGTGSDAGTEDGGIDAGLPFSWKDSIKQAFVESNPILFSPRYLKDSKDAFYLKDSFEKSVELFKKGKPLTETLRNKLDNCYDDYNQSKAVIENQLYRTQEIFALVSILSATQALDYMGEAEKKQMAAIFSDLLATLEKRGAVDKNPIDQSDLSPHVYKDLLVLIDHYVVGTLNISTRFIKASTDQAPLRLDALIMKTRILNSLAAIDAGLALEGDKSPNFRSPYIVWNDLAKNYSGIFENVLSMINQDNEIKKSIQDKKYFDFRRLSISLDEKLAQMKLLRETEDKLLAELKRAVETQFSVSKEILSID